MIRTLGALCVLGLAALLGWLGHGRYGSSTPSAGAQAQTCRVLRGRMEQNIKSVVGYVKPAPNALLRIGFPAAKDLSRTISLLTVREGDLVSPSTVLAQLDHSDLTATREQLSAELRVAESRQNALKKQGPLDIRSAVAVLAGSTAQRDHAQRNYERKKEFRKDNLVGAAEVEMAHHDVVVAQTKYDQANVGLQQVRARVRSDLATQQRQIEQINTLLQGIEVQIRWCTLRSPLTVSAQVFAVHQRQGELTSGQPHDPVLTLLDTSQLQAHLYIAEADFGRIKMEQPVSLRATSYPDRVLQGRIIRVLPQPVLQDNVVYYLAVVEVAEEQRSLLRVDMSVTAHIKAGVKTDALWLPLAAVRSRPDGWYVFRPGASGPVETPVVIGWQDQGRVEILNGLGEGDEVVLQP